MEKICEICGLENKIGKYKCPKCIKKYCGIECWKEHKETNCEEFLEDKGKEKLQETVSTQSVLFPTDDTIYPAELKLLSENQELKSLLRNGALREIIERVDKSKNVKFDIQQAMLEPIFVEFADSCLSIVEPPKK